MPQTASQPVYRGFDRTALDREYNARESVASFDAEYAKYVSVSAEVQQEHERIADIVYDETSGETLDLYPAEPGAPLFLWVHGGYGGELEGRQRFRRAGSEGAWLCRRGDELHAGAAGLARRDHQTDAHRRSLPPCPARAIRNAVALPSAAPRPAAISSGCCCAGGWQADFGLPGDAITVGMALSGLHDIAPLRAHPCRCLARA